MSLPPPSGFPAPSPEGSPPPDIFSVPPDPSMARQVSELLLEAHDPFSRPPVLRPILPSLLPPPERHRQQAPNGIADTKDSIMETVTPPPTFWDVTGLKREDYVDNFDPIDLEHEELGYTPDQFKSALKDIFKLSEIKGIEDVIDDRTIAFATRILAAIEINPQLKKVPRYAAFNILIGSLYDEIDSWGANESNNVFSEENFGIHFTADSQDDDGAIREVDVVFDLQKIDDDGDAPVVVSISKKGTNSSYYGNVVIDIETNGKAKMRNHDLLEYAEGATNKLLAGVFVDMLRFFKEARPK